VGAITVVARATQSQFEGLGSDFKPKADQLRLSELPENLPRAGSATCRSVLGAHAAPP
jgi:hypothetical protein